MVKRAFTSTLAAAWLFAVAAMAQTPDPASAPPAHRAPTREEIAQIMQSFQRASALSAAGQDAEAEAHYRNAVSVFADTAGPAHPITLELSGGLASNLMAQGRADEAIAVMEPVLDGLSAFYGEDSDTANDARRRLVMAYMRGADPERAVPLMGRVIAANRGDPQWTAIDLVTLGQLLNTLDRHAEAEAALTRALAFDGDPAVDPLTLAAARAHLADSLLRQRRLSEAETAMRGAIGALNARATVTAAEIDWRWSLAMILDAQGARPAAMVAYRQAAAAAAERRLGSQDRTRRREARGFAPLFRTLVTRAWVTADAAS